MTAQCEGMGEVGSARYEPALLPPCPGIRVLSYSNCQEIHSRQQTGPGSVSVKNHKLFTHIRNRAHIFVTVDFEILDHAMITVIRFGSYVTVLQ